MRGALVSYFDVGTSYGISDHAFTESQVAPDPDIGLIGISNPLGQGLTLRVNEANADLVERWRSEATRQVTRPEMETGWSSELGVSEDDFDRRLSEYTASHPIASCELTVYAVGTVFVKLEFEPGIDYDYIEGVLSCFEYAAYTVRISDALLDVAQKKVEAAVDHEPSPLADLARRQKASRQKDERGYSESRLFSSFTHLIIGTEEDDQEAELVRLMDAADPPPIDFEYHGHLYYSWPMCVIVARDLQSWKAKPQNEQWPPSSQVARMLLCIQIAHVFQGTLEAFRRLFLSEIAEQVGGYVRQYTGGREPQELNRLRTLALAVVNLTDFDLVTPTAEDQEYFKQFGRDAQIGKQQEQIQRATETLYNVQAAEAQDQEVRRQNLLNVIILLLTSFTLISVTADAYNFVRDQEVMIHERLDRVLVLSEFLLALALLLVIALYVTRPHRRRRRTGR